MRLVDTTLFFSPTSGGVKRYLTAKHAWQAELEAELGPLRQRMAPACGLWVCWPKRAARVPTNMTDQVVRDVTLPTGLVDNKVCAIDATWSALRLVIRRELR